MTDRIPEAWRFPEDCSECGETYTPQYGRRYRETGYCSNACKQRAYRRRKRGGILARRYDKSGMYKRGALLGPPSE